MDILKILIGPLSFLLIYLSSDQSFLSQDAKVVLGTLIWMIFWWVLEVVPLFVTAFLPILLFPTFGVMKLPIVTQIYASDILFLFLGGFLIAGAIEKWGLHSRISIWILRLFGTQPRRLIFGFIVATAFLSMWISNTASVIIMLPLATSILSRYRHHGEAFERATKFSIAYSASIGGVATIIGSPPNAIFVGYLESALGEEISFVQWMSFGVPFVCLGLFLLWIYLTRFAYRIPSHSPLTLDLSSFQETALSLAQKKVFVLFIIAVMGWIFRPILPIPHLSDIHIGLFVVFLLFLLPSEGRGSTRLLELSDLYRVEWSILLLFGGGLALSQGIQESGLGHWVGNHFQELGTLPSVITLLCICSFIILFTELGSNTAVAAVFIPIIAGMGAIFDIPLRAVLLAVTMAASLSFMLPMATPPNAMIFGRGGIGIREMARVGLWLNILFAILITLFANYGLPLIWF